MRASSLIVVLLACLATPAFAQRTVTVNLGDLLKRKADKHESAVQPATVAQNATASAMGFNVWVAGRPHEPFVSCAQGGICFHSTITKISAGQGEEVAAGEVLLRVDLDVEEDDNGRVTRDKIDRTVRCSKQRPLIEGYEVEFFADGQPNSSGTSAEQYLLVCHSFQGDAADGARRFGYPVVP